MWWYISVIPALGKLRQKDHKIEAIQTLSQKRKSAWRFLKK
jgi:hypothetical protein